MHHQLQGGVSARQLIAAAETCLHAQDAQPRLLAGQGRARRLYESAAVHQELGSVFGFALLRYCHAAGERDKSASACAGGQGCHLFPERTLAVEQALLGSILHLREEEGGRLGGEGERGCGVDIRVFLQGFLGKNAQLSLVDVSRDEAIAHTREQNAAPRKRQGRA